MTNWDTLKTAVANIINTNGNQEITGQLLQNVLNSIITNVGENATFAGIATPETNPGAPDGPVFYIAITPGTYSNFNGLSVSGVSILEWRNEWSRKSLNIPTFDLLRVKSNIAFLSCESATAVEVNDNNITFREGWDIYLDSLFFRAPSGFNQSFNLYSGSGYIGFNIETQTFFAGSSISDINSNSIVVGYNRFNEVIIFANKYTHNGLVKTVTSAISSIFAPSSNVAVSHNLLNDVCYQDALAITRGKVSINGVNVTLGAGIYYFYNKHTGGLKAKQLDSAVSFTFSSTNNVIVYNYDTEEFSLKNNSEITQKDVVCLIYDGSEGVCGGQFYEHNAVKDIKSVLTPLAPLDILRYKYLEGCTVKSSNTIFTEYIPVKVNDVIKWTSFLGTTAITLQEFSKDYTLLDQWTSPAGSRTLTLTRENTAFVRAYFSFTEDYRDQTVYVNDVLKAKYIALGSDAVGSAYFSNANIEVDVTTRVVKIKSFSDIYTGVKKYSTFYRFPEDYVFTLDSGGTNFILYNYKLHTLTTGEKIDVDTCVIGVKNGARVWFNGYYTVYYSDGEIVKSPISYNNIKETVTSAISSTFAPSSNVAVSHNLLNDVCYQDALAITRGKVSINGVNVTLGAGIYYFYNKHTGGLKAKQLDSAVSFTFSSTNNVIVYNYDTEEFSLKNNSEITQKDVVCLIYDGSEGVCGGQFYEHNAVKDIKSVLTPLAPLDILRYKYLEGCTVKSSNTIFTEYIPVKVNDVIKWTSFLGTTAITLQEFSKDYTLLDQWTSPAGSRTLTLTRENTAFVRAYFSFTEDYRDQTVYVNDVLKAKYIALGSDAVGSAYFSNANIEVDVTTRVVKIKSFSDIYTGVKKYSTFYRFPEDYVFTLDSGGTNFILYNYKLHTLTTGEKIDVDTCVIGVKNGARVWFNGYYTVYYSDGEIVKSPISYNNIKELISSDSMPSFVISESKVTYERVMQYLEGGSNYLLAHITDIHSGGTTKYMHAGYLNELNKTWGFSLLCNAGDIGLDVGETNNAALELMYNTKSQMNCTSPWLFCKGNHERLRTMTELGNVFMKPMRRQFPNIVFGDNNGLYGYIDDENSKVRTIYLNTSDTDSQTHYAISDEQVVWLGNTLFSTNDDYKIVILTHLCPKQIGEWTDNPGDWKIVSDLVKIVEGFAQRLTVSHSYKTWDYSNKTAKIVCVLSGDSHFNNFTKENGVNYIVRQGYGGISEASRPDGASSDGFSYTSQCLFDVLAIKDESNAKVFRIGAGGENRDLEITY